VSGCHAGRRKLVGEFAAGVHMRHCRRSLGRDGSPIARRAPRTCGPNCADSVCTIGGGPCQGVGGALAAPLASLREALSSQSHQPPRFLCERSPARWLHAMAKYILEGLSNTVLAAEYRTTLPNERLLAEEIARTRRQLDLQRQNAFRALPRRRRARPSGSRRASGEATT
jgi:hypothetical protein